ncbi:hypothetical protein KTO58_08230 [Chitinophaga pendula]|uniref:hypothetical protein n=1 Tax=Chitinophaga TaxID=79328 RepID=UPI000BB019E1|nr:MULTISPECIES: hypothetical protein [Chitinophaga]ASZ13222.1 hypothetical protein CK934_20780 [Chitinophaga sp. MD30]UCJ09159.1 hypothetical protein KTO58_08230 [Chitinophaga pendula]
MKKNHFFQQTKSLSREALGQINGGGKNTRAILCVDMACGSDDTCRNAGGGAYCTCIISIARCWSR